MNWMQKLVETYDVIPENQIGVERDVDGKKKPGLMPICHTTAKAQIEIILNIKGEFLSARVVDESTLIPCTEASSSKSGSRPIHHPLADKLQYVAGDFVTFGGYVTSGYSQEPMEPFKKYLHDLKNWTESMYCHPMVRAVYDYVKKNQVISDLAGETVKVLHLGPDKKLLEEWPGEKELMPEIFKVLLNNQKQWEATVRWIIEDPSFQNSATWKEPGVWNSWIQYYSSSLTNVGLCYVTGDALPLAKMHQSKIRHTGDKAKLISANDSSGFTTRGRFVEEEEAFQVGMKVSQKGHNALRWLINRQGYQDGDQAVVAWAAGTDIEPPSLLEDSYGLVYAHSAPSDQFVNTEQDLAIQLKRMTEGYQQSLGKIGQQVVVMGLDSATTGRMSIAFYRDLAGSEYLNRLIAWHESASWLQRFSKEKKFVGAPAPKDIATACYGQRLDDKLRKSTVNRILPCIIDGNDFPRDILESLVNRLKNRIGLEPWEWEKTLGITCGLYKHYYKERRYTMALEEDRHSRDYLYGRLLAIAERIERWALSSTEKGRQTTAVRLMQRFADHPASTWRNLELALVPYKNRLGVRAKKYLDLMDEIISSFSPPNDFTLDKPLSGEFLLGYHCQRQAFKKIEPETEAEINKLEEETEGEE